MCEIKKEVADEIMKEDNDFLMDPYDRQILLNKILDRARKSMELFCISI
jgi:hypothetical protein